MQGGVSNRIDDAKVKLVRECKLNLFLHQFLSKTAKKLFSPKIFLRLKILTLNFYCADIVRQ